MRNEKMYLYLDDVRIPTEGNWEVVRNYDEFVAHIKLNAYRDWETDRKSTRLNSSHLKLSRMPSSA